MLKQPEEYGLRNDGLYYLSYDQTREILNMNLRRLTGLEQEKIISSYEAAMDAITDLLDILSKPERITAIIGEELIAIKNEYTIKDARRSQIEYNAVEFETEDLITPMDMVVTLSNEGYIKSQPLSEYQAQNRGGKGKKATEMKDNDFVQQLFIANTHDYVLCFSSLGRLHRLKVWEVPQGGRNSKGRPIVNLFELQENEKITVVLPIKQFSDDQFIFLATAKGVVKKTALSQYSSTRKMAVIAVTLDEDDYLVGAELTDGNSDIMLFSNAGKAVRFDESSVRATGRSSRGVLGMRLEEGQSIISLIVSKNENAYVLTATENGYGKRTPVVEYTRHGRGTKGMIAIQTSERNGKVVAAVLVDESDEIMLITTDGIVVRTKVAPIRELGRATQGVKLIRIDNDTKLKGVQRVVESVSESEVGLDSDTVVENEYSVNQINKDDADYLESTDSSTEGEE